MATEQPGFSIGHLNANVDLSAKQYYAVEPANNSGVTEVALADTAAGQKALGILQNKPNAQGQVAHVMCMGVSKVVAGAAITAGAYLMVQASTGKLITAATTGSHVIGIALENAAADGDIISAFINCGTGVI